MRGLYLITNDDPIQLLLEKLDAALATRQIAILQYRRKKVDKADQPAKLNRSNNYVKNIRFLLSLMMT